MNAVVAGGSQVARAIVRYGVKYGPLVFEAVKHGREPAERAVRNTIARQAERRRAFEHAKTLVDGAVLRAYHRGEPVWVVFSGDVPVTAYPVDTADLAALLEHADLSQRVRPNDRRRVPRLPSLPKLPSPRNLPRPPWPRRK